MGINDYGAASDPLSSPSLSDWAADVAAAITAKPDEVADDTTPQLGGTLDVNGQSIVDATDGTVQVNDNLDVVGNVTVSGTVDGRDVAADGTKLDGIASGAEANTVDSVNAQAGDVVLDADDIDDTSTTHKFATAAQLSKIDGVESGADVTDAANVQAAGAVMTGDDAATLGSGAAADGQVLTADGLGGAAWETVIGGGGGPGVDLSAVETYDSAVTYAKGDLCSTTSGVFQATVESPTNPPGVEWIADEMNSRGGGFYQYPWVVTSNITPFWSQSLTLGSSDGLPRRVPMSYGLECSGLDDFEVSCAFVYPGGNTNLRFGILSNSSSTLSSQVGVYLTVNPDGAANPGRLRLEAYDGAAWTTLAETGATAVDWGSNWDTSVFLISKVGNLLNVWLAGEEALESTTIDEITSLDKVFTDVSIPATYLTAAHKYISLDFGMASGDYNWGGFGKVRALRYASGWRPLVVYSTAEGQSYPATDQEVDERLIPAVYSNGAASSYIAAQFLGQYDVLVAREGLSSGTNVFQFSSSTIVPGARYTLFYRGTAAPSDTTFSWPVTGGVVVPIGDWSTHSVCSMFEVMRVQDSREGTDHLYVRLVATGLP